MKGPPLCPGGEDITWPDQVAPRGRRTPSTRNIKPQTSNLKCLIQPLHRKTCNLSVVRTLARRMGTLS